MQGSLVETEQSIPMLQNFFLYSLSRVFSAVFFSTLEGHRDLEMVQTADYSKCGPRTHSIGTTRGLVRSIASQAHPDLLDQNLHFNTNPSGLLQLQFVNTGVDQGFSTHLPFRITGVLTCQDLNWNPWQQQGCASCSFSVFPAESNMQPELRTTNLAQLHGLLFFSPCFLYYS